MTIDDDNSVYVGGLPYDVTEESVRKVFDLYGHVVAVKINKDHGTGGKCYGFVTFTNPRSAVDAINDMDGRTIDGRVVKVNEVRTRGTRSNFGHDSFRRNSNQGRDRDRDRGRDRQRERSRGHDHQNRERGARDHDQTRARFVERERGFVERERGRDHDRAMEDIEQESERNLGHEREREWSSDLDQDKETEVTKHYLRSGAKERDQASKLLTGSKLTDRRSRELPSASSDKDHDQGNKQLDISNQKLEELQKEVSQMEELVGEKGQVVSKLQEKSQILEDALKAAKKLTSHRQMQLTKLHKCFIHMKDYSERLKSSELELQSLVNSTMVEIEEYGDDVGILPPLLANGNA